MEGGVCAQGTPMYSVTETFLWFVSGDFLKRNDTGNIVECIGSFGYKGPFTLSISVNVTISLAMLL